MCVCVWPLTCTEFRWLMNFCNATIITLQILNPQTFALWETFTNHPNKKMSVRQTWYRNSGGKPDSDEYAARVEGQVTKHQTLPPLDNFTNRYKDYLLTLHLRWLHGVGNWRWLYGVGNKKLHFIPQHKFHNISFSCYTAFTLAPRSRQLTLALRSRHQSFITFHTATQIP